MFQRNVREDFEKLDKYVQRMINFGAGKEDVSFDWDTIRNINEHIAICNSSFRNPWEKSKITEAEEWVRKLSQQLRYIADQRNKQISKSAFDHPSTYLSSEYKQLAACYTELRTSTELSEERLIEIKVLLDLCEKTHVHPKETIIYEGVLFWWRYHDNNSRIIKHKNKTKPKGSVTELSPIKGYKFPIGDSKTKTVQHLVIKEKDGEIYLNIEP